MSKRAISNGGIVSHEIVTRGDRIMSSIRHGGLMRCCIASIEDDDKVRRVEPNEGDLLRCKHCRDSNEPPNMVFRAGAWEWRGADMDGDLQLATVNPRGGLGGVGIV